MDRETFKDERGLSSLKKLYRDKILSKQYWEETGLHARSSDSLSKKISKQLYGYKHIVTVEALLRMGNFEKNKRVLEVGCGWGRIVIGLRKLFPALEIVGIDVVHDLLKLAGSVVTRETGLNDVRYFQCDAQNLSFREESFDIIYSVRVLQYVENPTLVLKGFRATLRNRGKVVVIIPNKLNPFMLTRYHTKTYSPFEVKNWLIRAGFANVRYGSCTFMPRFLCSSKSNLTLFEYIGRMPFLKYFGGQVVVSGEKINGGRKTEGEIL